MSTLYRPAATDQPRGPLPVLFTHYGDQWFRGSEQLLFDLLANLDRSRVEPILWCNGAPMAEAARSISVATYLSPMAYYFDYASPGFRPLQYATLVRQGLAIVRKHGIRILHANSAAPVQWLLPVARFARLPLLAHLHIGYLRRGRFVCLLHQADLVVGVSDQVTKDLRHDGMPPERTRTIYNGIDFTRLDRGRGDDVRDRLGIPTGAPVIATAGSLIRRKGHDVLIRAVAALPKERDVRLLIAGDGPDRAALEALAGSLGMAERVHFLGHFEGMADTYLAADVFALASRAEAFGLVLAEAGHFGRPAVATNVGGIPEVIEDGVTGTLVTPEDPDALAAALDGLISDPVRRRALGQAAKARAESLFGVGRMVSDFHATYDELARRPRKGLGWLDGGLSAAPYLKALQGWRPA